MADGTQSHVAPSSAAERRSAPDQTSRSRTRARGSRAAAAPSPSPSPSLPASHLLARIDEEIARASRQRSGLCCLLVQVVNLPELLALHGEAFAAHALEHVSEVLRVELRRYDRVGQPLADELVIVLPGATRAQGEAVARRALRRLRAIKVEIERVRQPLTVSIGIAAWTEPWSAGRLVEEARVAAAPSRCELGER
ncbi:MAG: GGDEF domain-containing protein [Solirubrobacteraceae bacterium]